MKIDGMFLFKGIGVIVCYNESFFVDVVVFGMIMWDYVDRVVVVDFYVFLFFGCSFVCKV